MNESAEDKRKLRDVFMRFFKDNKNVIKTPEEVKSEAFGKSTWFIKVTPAFLKDIGIEPTEVEDFAKPKEMRTTEASPKEGNKHSSCK